MSHFEKEQQLFSGNLPLPKKALSNVICKFLHIHAIVLNLIHRPVLVLTWGNLSNRKKHWASMSRGVPLMWFCIFVPRQLRKPLTFAGPWRKLLTSVDTLCGNQVCRSQSPWVLQIVFWKSYKKYKTLYQLPQCQYLFFKSTCTLRVFLCI